MGLSRIVKLETNESTEIGLVPGVASPPLGRIRTSGKVRRNVLRTAVHVHVVDPNLPENVRGDLDVVDFESENLRSISPALETHVGQEDLGILEPEPNSFISGTPVRLRCAAVDRIAAGIAGR
jgi:hypothetical protein